MQLVTCFLGRCFLAVSLMSEYLKESRLRRTKHTVPSASWQTWPVDERSAGLATGAVCPP